MSGKFRLFLKDCFFSPSHHPNQTDYGAHLARRSKANRSPLSSVEVTNVWSFTSTHSIGLHGMAQVNFSCSF